MSPYPKVPNPISLRQRGIEVLIDYLVILAYLIILALVTLAGYFLFLGGVPKITMWQSQAIALVTSVAPMVLVFTQLDFRGAHGSYGKRVANLRVQFQTQRYWRSLVRNCVKFLPWQLAHQGVIEGVYTDFTSLASQLLPSISLALAVVLVAMMLLRPDKRHLGDLLAGTQVIAAR